MRYLLFLLLFCCAHTSLRGQNVEETLPEVEVVEEPENELEEGSLPEGGSARASRREIFDLNKETATLRPLAPQVWQQVTQSTDYSQDVPEVKKEKKADAPRKSGRLPDFSIDRDFWKNFFKVIAIITLLIAGGWMVYQMIQAPSNSVIRAEDGTEITLDNLDEYIQEVDLRLFLQDAIKSGQYGIAVRVYYLQLIKNLSQSNAIVWQREKTNRDYIREMRSHRLSPEFRWATRTYEEVWYGNATVDARQFSGIEQKMQQVLNEIPVPKQV